MELRGLTSPTGPGHTLSYRHRAIWCPQTFLRWVSSRNTFIHQTEKAQKVQKKLCLNSAPQKTNLEIEVGPAAFLGILGPDLRRLCEQ